MGFEVDPAPSCLQGSAPSVSDMTPCNVSLGLYSTNTTSPGNSSTWRLGASLVGARGVFNFVQNYYAERSPAAEGEALLMP